MGEAKKTRLYKQVFLLGMVIILGAGYFLVQNIMMVANDIKTTATVTKVKQQFQRAGETTRTYVPTVKYVTETGRAITGSTGYGSSMYNFDVGDKVTVYYDPQNPTSFNIIVPLSTWALPVFGVLFGCLILWSGRKL